MVVYRHNGVVAGRAIGADEIQLAVVGDVVLAKSIQLREHVDCVEETARTALHAGGAVQDGMRVVKERRRDGGVHVPPAIREVSVHPRVLFGQPAAWSVADYFHGNGGGVGSTHDLSKGPNAIVTNVGPACKNHWLPTIEELHLVVLDIRNHHN
jgi:hypothetical protein